MPSSAWIDDYFEWSVEDTNCCHKYENGTFCPREVEDYDERVDEKGTEKPEYIGGVDFDKMYDDMYEYDYTYGDLDVNYDHVDEPKPKRKSKPAYKEDINNDDYHYGDYNVEYDHIDKRKHKSKPAYKEDVYNYDYTYGDTSVDYDSGIPAKGEREVPGDDGWPSNSKDPSETRRAHRKYFKEPATPACQPCNINTVPNNPFRPEPEVFNQYLPMFLKDNPDMKCPKAGHAAYGQVRGLLVGHSFCLNFSLIISLTSHCCG